MTTTCVVVEERSINGYLFRPSLQESAVLSTAHSSYREGLTSSVTPAFTTTFALRLHCRVTIVGRKTITLGKVRTIDAQVPAVSYGN